MSTAELLIGGGVLIAVLGLWFWWLGREHRGDDKKWTRYPDNLRLALPLMLPTGVVMVVTGVVLSALDRS